MRHSLREVAAAFEPDCCALSALWLPQDDLPTQSIRHRSFVELLQNGDVSDDDQIIMEDELFKHGYLDEQFDR